MNLIPYPSIDTRDDHVFRHVFEPRERWWEVFGDLETWHRDWSTLRSLGCFGDARGWRLAAVAPGGRAVLDTNHTAWLGAAETACIQAEHGRRVFPTENGRTCYVGDGGVTVYVARRGHLVTCFRPAMCVGSRRTPPESTSLAMARVVAGAPDSLRAAVRRLARRASLSIGGSAPSQGDPR